MREPVEIPLERVLDLHSFRPEDVRGVVIEYLRACREAGFAEVRLIHGRGKGVQRASVRTLLKSVAGIAYAHDAPPDRGGWGATIVGLRPLSDEEQKRGPR